MVVMSRTWSTRDLLVLGFPDPEPEFEMPDLDDLRPHNVVALSLEAFAVRLGPTRQRYFETWMNMARLAEKAQRAYDVARTHLTEYRRHAYERQVAPYYLAVDNLEDAITATYRGFLVAQRLSPLTGRALPQPTKRQTALLRTAYDYVEGADEWLAEARSPVSDLFIVAPRAKYAVIASIRLPYQDLAWCIRKLHRCVQQIATVSD